MFARPAVNTTKSLAQCPAMLVHVLILVLHVLKDFLLTNVLVLAGSVLDLARLVGDNS